MTYASEVQADAPLWFAQMNEASGSSFADDAGSSHTGTWTGSPSVVAGLVPDGGNARLLNGTTQYGEVGFGSWMEGFTAFTLEAVVKGTGTSGSILSRASSTSPYRLGFTGGKPFVAVRTNLGGEELAIGATSVNDGNRHHIAGTWTGSTLTIYVDGVSDGTLVKGGSIVSGSSTALRVGQRNSDSFWAGTVDCPALYSTNIGPTRIAVHAAALSGASGSASLSLSASGSAKAQPSGSASLSLSASAAAAAPIAATASLSLSASGATKAPAGGTASITLTASGTVEGSASEAAGDAAISLSATGAGQAPVTGLAAITLDASGVGAGQVVGFAAFSLSASGVAGGALSGTAQIDLDATGLVAAPMGGTAFLVLTADGSAHAPFRDVDVLAIVDLSRLVEFADLSRTVDLEDVSRLVTAALTDGTTKMNLRSEAREFYTIQITTDPQVTAWQASFDSKATWFDGELVDGTTDVFRWLVRGPDFDATGQVVATSAPLVAGTVKPIIRASDDPEVIWRSSADKVPTISVKASA